MDEALRDTARRFLNAYEGGNWETVRELTGAELHGTGLNIDPEELLECLGEWPHAASVLVGEFSPPKEWIAIEELVETQKHWKQHHSNKESTIERLSVESGSHVAFLLERTETHDGMYYGHEPTGKEITLPVVGVLELEDGLVREFWSAWSFPEFLVQMGISPRSGIEAKVENQFYEVINRIIRHNLRTSLNAIGGYAELIADDDGYAERIATTTDELTATMEKVRELERRVLRTQGTEPLNLEVVLREVISSLSDSFPNAEIDVQSPEKPVRLTTSKPLVKMAVREAVENGVTHNDADVPAVNVRLREPDSDEYAAIITVSDNGPGIPEHETTPLVEERETQLEHASGLGLWTIKWCVERVGGDVTFRNTDSNGSAVVIRLPNEPFAELA